jgi:hypothetical protein
MSTLKRFHVFGGGGALALAFVASVVACGEEEEGCEATQDCIPRGGEGGEGTGGTGGTAGTSSGTGGEGGGNGGTTGGTESGGASGTTSGGSSTGGRGGTGSGTGGSTGGGTSGAGGAAGAGGGGCEEPLMDCDGECVDVMQNGDHCGACDTPCNGVCVDGDCDTSCPDNRLRCANVCCSLPPANAAVSCESNQCETSCNTGYNDCGSTATVECFPNADVVHCGPSCLDCRVPNTNSSCQNLSGGWRCVNTCVGTPLGCAQDPMGRPDCGAWGFESGTTEGITEMVETPVMSALDGSMTSSTAWSSIGTRSLAVPFNSDGADRFGVQVKIPLCRTGSSAEIATRQVSFVARAESASGVAPLTTIQNNNYLIFYNGTATTGSRGDFNVESGVDTPATFMLDDTPASTDIVIFLRVFVAWRGTIYLDDIRVQ